MLDFSVTFVITIINITVLFLVLRKILFKPVTKFMDDRSRRIQDSIEQSEADKASAKDMLARYEAQLEAAEAEAQDIIINARKQAQLEAERIIANGHLSAEAAMASARKKFEDERRFALAQFKQEAASLVISASSRLLEREIKTEDCRAYAQKLIEEAGGA